MKIKYVWATSGKDPREVCDITLEQSHIPRVGELVDIEVQIEKDEWVSKSGRVTDVVNFVKREQSVTVLLGK